MIVYYFEDASSLSSSLVVGIRFLHLKTFFCVFTTRSELAARNSHIQVFCGNLVLVLRTWRTGGIIA